MAACVTVWSADTSMIRHTSKSMQMEHLGSQAGFDSQHAFCRITQAQWHRQNMAGTSIYVQFYYSSHNSVGFLWPATDLC